MTFSSLLGCSSSDELTKLRLNEVIRSVFYVSMYVAINQGFFEEEGLMNQGVVLLEKILAKWY